MPNENKIETRIENVSGESKAIESVQKAIIKRRQRNCQKYCQKYS